MRFGKNAREQEEVRVSGRDDGGGASAASRGEVQDKQPQDVRKEHSDSSTDLDNKSVNSEADAMYSNADSQDLNASFEKGKVEDTEGA